MLFELWCWRIWELLGLQGDQTSQSLRKSVLKHHWKDWCWSSNTWPPDAKSQLIRKDLNAGKVWRQEEKRIIEDKRVGWHHQLNGHKFEQAPGDGEGQGSLAFCSPWDCKELDMTEWLNNNKYIKCSSKHRDSYVSWGWGTLG